MGEPRVVIDDALHSVAMGPRFCIKAIHGARPSKFRVVGDLTRPWANSVKHRADTYWPKRQCHLLVIFRALCVIGESDLSTWSRDSPNDYITFPANAASAGMANVLLASPQDGLFSISKIRGRPFGSFPAPNNWGG